MRTGNINKQRQQKDVGDISLNTSATIHEIRIYQEMLTDSMTDEEEIIEIAKYIYMVHEELKILAKHFNKISLKNKLNKETNNVTTTN